MPEPKKRFAVFRFKKNYSNSIGVLEMLQCYMNSTVHCYVHNAGPVGEVIARAALNMGENCQNEKLPF